MTIERIVFTAIFGGSFFMTALGFYLDQTQEMGFWVGLVVFAIIWVVIAFAFVMGFYAIMKFLLGLYLIGEKIWHCFKWLAGRFAVLRRLAKNNNRQNPNDQFPTASFAIPKVKIHHMPKD